MEATAFSLVQSITGDTWASKSKSNQTSYTGTGTSVSWVLNGKWWVLFDYSTNNSSVENEHLWIYDPATDTWAAGPITNIGTDINPSGYGGGVVNGYGYLITSGTLWKIDPNVNTVTNTSFTQSSGNEPGNDNCCSLSLNNKIFLFGGSHRLSGVDYFQNTYNIFDPSTNIFTLGGNLPSGMSNAGQVSGSNDATNKGYILGGTNTYTSPTASSFTNTCFEFDAVANTFTQKANFPRTIVNQQGIVFNGLFYVWGGQTWVSSALTFAPDSFGYALDPVANTWNTISPAPNIFWGLNIAVFNNSIYMTGGQVPNGKNSGMYVFTPGSATAKSVALGYLMTL